jgi:hypothetical protein
MIYLIGAQLCRIGVVWASKAVTRKIFKTAAITFVGFYLCERVQRQRKKDKLYEEKYSNGSTN